MLDANLFSSTYASTQIRQRMHKNAPRLIPLSGQALPLSPDGSPPTDFTLIPAGPLTTVYGTFDWTARSAKSVAAQWAKRNRRFMWDYEHFSTAKDKDGKPITDTHARRAAGNATPLADPSGFHMRSQSWTPDATGYIRKQEYLYYSPVIAVDEETGEIIDVLKSALTNDPATLGCAPLMLSTLGLEALVNDAAVGHVLAEGEALTDSCVPARGQQNAEGVTTSDSDIQTSLQARIARMKERKGLSEDTCPSDKLPGLYDPNTDPSVPGSAASKLPSFSELSGADGVVPALRDAFGALLATHGQPQQPTAVLSPSMALNTLGGVVTHDPELYAKDESIAWDSEAARLRVWAWAGDDFLKARPAFGYVKGDGTTREDYMLIHHDVKGDALVTVRGGVLEAINSMQWCSVPEQYLAQVRQHLQEEAVRFGDRAPWVELSALAYRVLGKEPPTVALNTASTIPLNANSDKHTLAMAAHPHGSPAKHNVSSVLVHNADTGHTLWGRRNDSNKFTSPGGHVREGEHPVDAAARELKEETGLDLPRHQLCYMGTVRLSHPVNGSPMDVHGYSCAIPSHVKPDHEKDPEKEVKGWDWHAEHPLAEMHAPVNALSVLSTAKMGSAKGFASLSKQTTEQPATTADLTAAPKLALDDNDSEMDMNTLKALTATFISSGSGEGLTPEVEQKRQVALAAVKALDDALAATGAKDGAVDLGGLISLSQAVADATGAKTGQVGAVISLAARAEAQPIALQLSQDQLKANYIELAFNGGRINGKTRADVTAKIKSLSLADCEQLTKGPKIYEAPNQQGAPQGDNSATRTVELVSDRGPINQGITSAPPEDLVGKKIELTAADLAAIASAKQNGVNIDPAKVLASKQALAAKGQSKVRIVQHPGGSR